ncbi:MAG: AAA family ATPase [Acidobacteria bacterium]|nr:AAA family ATPase [Acidobacteriota bacterium]
MFEGFRGNAGVVSALRQMCGSGRIPQTILLAGPEGVGKATLARKFAAHLLSQSDAHAAELIERDDLSLEANRTIIAEREKWPSEKRAEDPLLFASHPDFLTFCPEGPLRQLSIQQMRLVKSRSQLRPLKGERRIFLIDQIDRASAQSADSLLKTLEEPPPHLILVMTAQNAFDLPQTIRSRSVLFHLSPLSPEEMEAFGEQAGWKDAARRAALAPGCPGLAATMDLAVYEKRRGVMLAMLEASSAQGGFAAWVKASESLLASKSEKLDFYLRPLYAVLEDLVVLHSGGGRVRNEDVRPALEKIAGRVGFEWLMEAVQKADEMVALQRRNVQKGPTLDSYVVGLRGC